MYSFWYMRLCFTSGLQLLDVLSFLKKEEDDEDLHLQIEVTTLIMSSLIIQLFKIPVEFTSAKGILFHMSEIYGVKYLHFFLAVEYGKCVYIGFLFY